MRRFLARTVSFLRREQADREMAREIESHLVLIEDDFVRRGMTPEEARLAARRTWGGVEQTRELHRDARSFVWLEQLFQDARHAWRSLVKSPSFVAVAMLSLAFGIGVNTAIFTLVNGILIRKLPVAGPERIVQINGKLGEFNTNAFSLPAFRELRRRAEIFSDVIGFSAAAAMLEAGQEPKSINLEIVTGSYFSFFGGRPELGRLLAPDDDRDGARPVCVLSHRLWRTQFGADPAVRGRQVRINGVSVEVAGVADAGFGGAEPLRPHDLWVATSFPDAQHAGRQSFSQIWIHAMGRLRRGISLAEGRARLESASRAIEEALPQDRPNADAIYILKDGSKGFDSWSSTLHDPLIVLMAAVSLVLMVASANLANLLLARMSDRRREFAIKLSLGVSRWRLLRQLLMEALALALAGGAAGILISAGLTSFLLKVFKAGNRARPLAVSPDPAVFAFAFGVCVLTALVAGLYPAWRASRADPVVSLKGGTAREYGRSAARRILILVQVALSVPLLFGAGVFTHSLRNLQAIDLGYDIDHVLTFDLRARTALKDADAAAPALLATLERVRRLPGIESAAYAFPGVLSENSMATQLKIRESSGALRNLGMRMLMTAGPGYFATMRMRLVRGRDFSPADRSGGPRVAIVNERFASRVWPGQDPIGKRLMTGPLDMEVVGLVRDAKYQDFRDAAPATLYVPRDQMPDDAAVMTVRCHGSLAAAERAIRGVIGNTLPEFQVSGVSSLDASRDGQMSRERALAFLGSLFGALGTALSLVGIYGLISYSVSSRAREIGVRISVGAQTHHVLWLFARESVALTAAGALIGIPAALMLSRFIAKLLYKVPTYDPAAVAIALGALAAGALLASLFPCRRAARIDPMEALRCD